MITNALGIELIDELLRLSGKARICAIGTSMFPSIWPGDELEIRRISDRIAVGQVIAWVRDRRIFIHRVVSISEDGRTIVTQGDRLAAPDPALGSADVIGVVVGATRAGRMIRVRQRLTWGARLVRAVSRLSDKPAVGLLRLGQWGSRYSQPFRYQNLNC